MPGRFLNKLFLLLSLVKMVYKMAEEHRREPSWPEVEHAIRRNFGGLDEIDPVKVFRKYFRAQFSLGRSDTVGVVFFCDCRVSLVPGGGGDARKERTESSSYLLGGKNAVLVTLRVRYVSSNQCSCSRGFRHLFSFVGDTE